MDLSIMKLLEDDEDETIHSGADVDAFTAALNRDIEGDTNNASENVANGNGNVDGDAGVSVSKSEVNDGKEVSSLGSDSTSHQLVSQWQNSSLDENVLRQKQKEPTSLELQERHPPKQELIQSDSSAEKLKQATGSSQESSQDVHLNGVHHSIPLPSISGLHVSGQSHDHFSEDRMKHPDNQHQYSKSIGNQQVLSVNATNDPITAQQTMKLIPSNNPVTNQQTLAAQPKNNSVNNQQPFTVNPTNNSISNQHTMSTNPKNNPLDNPQALPAKTITNPIGNQQALAATSPNNPVSRNKQVPFGVLLPVITPHLDKDRSMLLQAIYAKLRKNELGKDEFVRQMKSIVGDTMLRQAVNQISLQQEQARVQAARNAQTATNQLQRGDNVPTDSSRVAPSEVQVKMENSQKSESQGIQVNQTSSSVAGLVSHERGIPPNTLGGQNIQQQHQAHLSHTSFPIYASSATNFHPHPFSASSVTSGASSMKSQDAQIRHVPHQQAISSTQSGSGVQPINPSAPVKFDAQNSANDPRRLHGRSHPHITSHPTLQNNQVPWQSSMSKEQKTAGASLTASVKHELVDQNKEQHYKSQMSASGGSPAGSSSFRVGQVDQGYTAPPITLNNEAVDTLSNRNSLSSSTAVAHANPRLDPSTLVRNQVTSASTPFNTGTSIKTVPKKPLTGQKKPLDSLGTPTQVISKKQKVSGSFQDQSIEQLNDVTAVSGVNLREEEEQLLSGPKEESRASEATRRVVQEEEEKLILQKLPLHNKLQNIMSKCGIKNISNDVERCLSLSVEERLRGFLCSAMRHSKQRVDIEKRRHQTSITLDVGHDLFSINRKAKEELEKKLAEEAEQARKVIEAEGIIGPEGDKEKEDSRLKSLKANKEEDEKMRTTAANVAARVAVGGDDALIRFQLKAEQGRQKREGGGTDAVTSTQFGVDAPGKSLLNTGRTTRDNQDPEQRVPSNSAVALGVKKKIGKNLAVPVPKVVRRISVKDVIAALEKESQMARSTFLFRLHERPRAKLALE